MTPVYLNGQFVARDQATISVFDRGFLFADGIYEVVAYFNRCAPFLAEHFARLEQSCRAISLPCPFDLSTFTSVVESLAQKESSDDFLVYCQITRGAQPTRAHPIPEVIEPTVFVMTQSVPAFSIERLKRGFHAASVIENRWSRCDIKSVALLANVLALQSAKMVDSEAVEAIYFADDILHEGASSAVMIVKEGVIQAPPDSHALLPSITRCTMQKLAHSLDIPFEAKQITKNDVINADEIFIASASRILFPITKLDNQPVSNGEPGPIWLKLIQAFQKHLAQL